MGRFLVDAFVHGEQKWGWNDWLSPVQQRWATAIGNGAEQQALPWYLEPGVQQGAFATFLGVVLTQDPETSLWLWQAVAVGDSCFFQTRGDSLVQAFPLAQSTAFDNTPWLVGSRTPLRTDFSAPAQRLGQAWANDRLWLMTDALAQWFLAQCEHGGKPWLTIEQLLHERDADQLFRDWITDLRRRRQLRNDDVTLIGVALEENTQ